VCETDAGSLMKNDGDFVDVILLLFLCLFVVYLPIFSVSLNWYLIVE